MKTEKLIKENCSRKTSEIVGIEIHYSYQNFKLTLAFRRVNAWPSRAQRERRCATTVISKQRHFCSMR